MLIPSSSKITDAQSLIEFHERLLFLRAYPPNRKALKEVERRLAKINQQLRKLRAADADLSPLDDPEVSGISGTSVTSNFSYPLVRWLVAMHSRQLSIDWDWFDEEDRFGAVMPRFLPLLEDDAMVEAHVPFRGWVRRACGRANEVEWLVNRFESLDLPDQRKAELYDSLKLHITWRFGARASRTRMRLAARHSFFHDGPLIQRRDISLEQELNAAPIPLTRLNESEGEK